MLASTQLLILRAQDNRSLLDRLSSDSTFQRGWQVTFLFYSSIYWLKAYFAEEGIVDPESHRRRLKYVRQSDALKAIGDDFGRLQAYSETARYTLLPIEAEELMISLASFGRIQTHLSTLIDPEAPPRPMREALSTVEDDQDPAS